MSPVSRRLWTAILLLALTPQPARANEQPIEHFTLKNGMEVYVLPNPRVPAVNHTLWFKVGSADDPPGKSGLAHYHEHMMFQGTAQHGKGEYSQIIARNGGRENAFTSYDTTGYYVSIAKEKLPLVMELEADRIAHLIPGPEDALKEREVIIEERRARIENNPGALFDEQLDAALLLNHPYRLPVIGWMHEMQTLSLQDVMNFHSRYTQAGNAILVLTGDITVQEAKALAEKYYGALPAGEKPDRHWKSEPSSRTERVLTMRHADVKQPGWTLRFLAPTLVAGDTAQALPLTVLSYILGGGRTSRLYQSLVVEQKIATEAASGYNAFSIGPTALGIDVTPAAGQAMAAMRPAVRRELDKIAREGVTAQELSRAKTLLKADAIYGREGLQEMGQIIGWMLVIGLPADMFNRWPAMIDAVTAEQISQAAKAVFKDESSVEGWLLPGEAHE